MPTGKRTTRKRTRTSSQSLLPAQYFNDFLENNNDNEYTPSNLIQFLRQKEEEVITEDSQKVTDQDLINHAIIIIKARQGKQPVDRFKVFLQKLYLVRECSNFKVSCFYPLLFFILILGVAN